MTGAGWKYFSFPDLSGTAMALDQVTVTVTSMDKYSSIQVIHHYQYVKFKTAEQLKKKEKRRTHHPKCCLGTGGWLV